MNLNKPAPIVADPVKQYKRQKCTLLFAVTTVLICALLLWRVYNLVVHYQELVTAYRSQYLSEKIMGEAQWNESCHNKPPGYVTQLLNCSLAFEWKSHDVDTKAKQSAIRHIGQHDVSFRGLILDCHGPEPCRTFLARLLDAIIDNISLMLWTIIVGSIATVMVMLLTRSFWKTYKLKRTNDANTRLMTSGVSTQAFRALFNVVKDTAEIASAIRSDNLREAVANVNTQYELQKKNNQEIPVQLYEGDGFGYVQEGMPDWKSHGPDHTEHPLPKFPMSPDETNTISYNPRV